MPPRSRTTSTPEFLTSPTVGELVAIGLEQLANPTPPTPQDGDTPHDVGAPALTPHERALRSMFNRAAGELREHHANNPDEP